MENVSEREFMEKFGQLTPQNQRYLVSIQEALSFAQQTGTQLNSDELKKRFTGWGKASKKYEMKKITIYMELHGNCKCCL